MYMGYETYNFSSMCFTPYKTYADPESFAREVPTLATVFVIVDEVWTVPNTTVSGPSSAKRHLNGVSLAC